LRKRSRRGAQNLGSGVRGIGGKTFTRRASITTIGGGYGASYGRTRNWGGGVGDLPGKVSQRKKNLREYELVASRGTGTLTCRGGIKAKDASSRRCFFEGVVE